MDYDLIVIGAGPGGYVAAIRAAQLGRKVAITEKDALGGTCLNRGCIPTKALAASCDTLRTIRTAGKLGIEVTEYFLDFGKVMEHKNQTVNMLRKGVETLLRKNGVDVLFGLATFLDKNTIQINSSSLSQTYTSQYFLLATGSEAKVFPSMNYDGEKIVTSDEILNLEDVPKDLLIVGGGVVGCEFASIFAELGSNVVLVEILEDILPGEDGEIRKELLRYFKRSRINVKTATKIESIARTDNGDNGNNGDNGDNGDNGNNGHIKAQLGDGNVLYADVALLSLGRKPYTSGLGLDRLGMVLENSAVKINDYLQTSVENIYAVGDVTGRSMLAHVASKQGIQAVENMFGSRKPMNYDVIPSCIFTYPEIGTVGMNEEQAKDKGIEHKVGRFHFRANGKALAMNELNGFVKVIADGQGVIIGAQIIGPHASDLIHEFALAAQNRLTIADVASTIHAHPTLSEALVEAVEDLEDRAIHK